MPTSSLTLEDHTIAIIGMFVAMVIVITFVYAIIHTRWSKTKNEDGSLNYVNGIACALVFGFLAIVATHYFSLSYGTIGVDGETYSALINVRDFPVMLAGLIGGPIAGIGAGLIGGVERFACGGATAVPCMLGTIMSGLVGGLIWWFAGKKFPKIYVAVIAMLIMETVHIGLVAVMSTPANVGPEIINVIGVPVIVCNTLGMIIFVLLSKWFHNNRGTIEN